MTHDTRMEGETGQQGTSSSVEVPMLTEGFQKGQFPSDQQERGTVLVAVRSLPSPVPCTGSAPPDSDISTVKALSLPHQSTQNNPAVNRYYPHLDLPSTPEYFFSDEIVFTPNPELLAKMVEIGFTEKVATKALYWTGNSNNYVAVNWIMERNEKTLNTPLEIEVKMLKADLDMKNEESRERIMSIDSGICMVDDDETGFISIDSDDLDVYKLVLVVNKSFRFSPEALTELVGRATGHIIAKVGMLAEGDIQLEMWETCGEQVMVYKGENTRHLLDLRLSAQCLGVEWVEEGRYWDRVNRIYREVAVLGIWGLVDSVGVLVGRLERMVQSDAGSM